MNKDIGLTLSILFMACQLILAQTPTWQVNTEKSAAADLPSLVVDIDLESLASQLATAPVEGTAVRSAVSVRLPMKDGTAKNFSIVESPIMEPALAAKFPGIKTYIASSLDGETWGRLSVTGKGFHGILFSNEGTTYLDPHGEGSLVVYDRMGYINHRSGSKFFSCGTGAEEAIKETMEARPSRSGEQLRTYRLALSCTGEYTDFHGGTVAGALSAMVVTMNRVNGIYERELAIRMVLIGNNDLLIYTNSATDPYNNGDVGDMIDENGPATNAAVGSNAYDIGHVFYHGNGGGLANLGVVCTFWKAGGVTGTNSPEGDPFDVDYVAHEMGHQFGANHTQNNSCNRNGSTAFEPGSGSTIMGYAGICPPNLQNHSDDYFHAGSFDEIYWYTRVGDGDDCPLITNTGNSGPVVSVPSGGFFIPKSTPFVLEGSATDADGDGLTYCWEQMDLGPSGSLNSPSGNAPIFRSREPVTVPYRYFPQLQGIITGSLPIGEVYASYARNLSFRLTVRDNNPAGGGVGFEELAFHVDGNSGPFKVMAPAANETIEAGNYYTVEWDVAGTDQTPVNCQLVDIYISYDHGFTYPDTIATGLPNSGSADVIMPHVISNAVKVRVQAADNIFFNINDGFVKLVQPSAPEDFGITLDAVPDYVSSVELTWTDSFANENYFVIERSIGSNGNFVVIDSVDRDVTSYVDSNISFSASNFYRVYARNAGGVSVLSNEATYGVLGVSSSRQEQVKVYPNPAIDHLLVSLPTETGGETEALIYDVQGKLIATKIVRGDGGRIDVAGFAAGSYTLKILEEGKPAFVHKFSVVK